MASPTITPTDHMRNEWRRAADAFQSAGCAAYARTFRYFADRSSLAPSTYDTLASAYRAWLVFGEFPPAI